MGDFIRYEDMEPSRTWESPDSFINKYQQQSIARLVDLCQQAHTVDVLVRINGRTEALEADWIKHLRPKNRA